jgi:hypothetical protein
LLRRVNGVDTQAVRRSLYDPWQAIMRNPAKRRRVFSWLSVYFIGTIVLVSMHVPEWGVLVAALGLVAVSTFVEVTIALRQRRERRRPPG